MNFIGNNPNMNLTQHQLDVTSQINQMLAQSSDALMCGPDCQKKRQTDKLKQQYVDAQTNIKTAPSQLKQAEKNYYTFAEGDAVYNKVLDNELTQKADKIGETMQQNFNESVDNATTLNETYNSLYTNYQHVLELYNDYIDENDELNRKIMKHGSDIVTTDRKTYYETQNYETLVSWYRFFRWIYFILVVAFIIAIFLADSTSSLLRKIFMLILVIAYPLVITYVVTYAISIRDRIILLMPKNIYKSM